MLTLTAEQVRTLAPDASAARSGEALGDRRRWTAAGRSDVAAWGLCQGSGSTPYQVAVDIAGPAYKCSCPSRKIPCKHALGLLFLVADGGAPTANPPDWVQSWLDSRASRAAAAATRPERAAEIDPEARAKRVASRERKVAAGIDELDRWLRDLMRRGLDSTRSEGYRFWDAMGARLVDAQAGGLGRSVRGLGSAANSGDAWPHLLLEGAGRLHLLSEAYRRADELPADLRADVRSLVGWNLKEEELDPANAVEDRWLVIGQRIDDRGDIVTARTFLIGETSARVGLHLAFGVGAAPPTLLAAPGQAFQATLTFYPSATPLRVAVAAADRARRRSNGHPSLDHAGCGRRGPWLAPRTKPVRWCLAGPHRRRRARPAGRPAARARCRRDRTPDRDRRRRTASARDLGRPSDPAGRRMGWRMAPTARGVCRRPTRIRDGRRRHDRGEDRRPGLVRARLGRPAWDRADRRDRAHSRRRRRPRRRRRHRAGDPGCRRVDGRTTQGGPDNVARPGAPAAPGRTRPASAARRPAGAIRRACVRGATIPGTRSPRARSPDRSTSARRVAPGAHGASRRGRTKPTPPLFDLGGTRAAWLARTFPDMAADAWWGIGEDWDEAWAATASGAARAALVRRFRERGPAPRPTIPGGPLVGDRDR